MQYIYKDRHDREIGPVSSERMLQLIAAGEVTASTPVRNAMMGGYERADRHQLLKAKLAERSAPNSATDSASAASAASATAPAASLRTDRDSDGSYIPTVARKLLALRENERRQPASRGRGLEICLRRVIGGIFDLVFLLPVLGLFMLLSFSIHWDAGDVKVWRSGDASGNGGYFVLADRGVPHGSAWYVSDPGGGRTEKWQRFEVNRPYRTFSVANSSDGAAVDFSLREVARWMTLAACWWLAWAALYYFVSAAVGCTPGMALTGLRVDAGGAGRFSAASGFAGAMLLCGWLYPVTALFTRGRGLHQLLSRTSIVRK